jgi:hypothetical protein
LACFDLPSLEGRNISTVPHGEQSEAAAALPMDVEQRSYVLIEFPHANAAACAQR